MKVGDLIVDSSGAMLGTGIVLCVRECWVQGKLTDSLSVESYWPERELQGKDPIVRHHTGLYFQYEVLK